MPRLISRLLTLFLTLPLLALANENLNKCDIEGTLECSKHWLQKHDRVIICTLSEWQVHAQCGDKQKCTPYPKAHCYPRDWVRLVEASTRGNETGT